MKSNFLYQDVDVVSLVDKGIVVRCFVCRNYDKTLMETGKQWVCDNTRVTKNGLVSGVDRMFKSSDSAFKHITDRKSVEFDILVLWCWSSGAMEMRQALYISVPCVKDLVVCHFVRYWDHLSLYGHMEHKENQSRNKVRDSENSKTLELDLLQTCFVVENFGSNHTCIAIRNAWQLYSKYGGIFL